MKGDTPMMAGHPPTQREQAAQEAALQARELGLHMAALFGDARGLHKWLTVGGEGPDARDHNGETPLHLAARNGHVQCMELLEARGASVDAANGAGETALMLAAAGGEAEAARALLAWGADVALADAKGRTALHHAARQQDPALAQLLLERGAAVDCQDAFGATPLHGAVCHGCAATAELLLAHRAQPGAAAWDGRTAFHLAAERADTRVLARLLPLASAAQLDGSRDQQGNSPLHAAAGSGSAAAAELLLRAGMAVDSPGMLRWTPLHFAVRGRHTELAQLLLRAGASPHAAAADGLSVAAFLQRSAGRAGFPEMLAGLRDLLPLAEG